ncbi:uncharacterized protein [Triticum aestivum]|uniref:uncharacterized protein n=1 Tax=Triticum aestivum TaxID=4565 RepID=UPI001D016221|nr:uncharacterized protein LOC123166705 [Triticum aestivum]
MLERGQNASRPELRRPPSFTARLRRPHQDDAATDARLRRSTPEVRSSPPPLEGAPSPLNTTTASATRSRLRPSPYLRRRPAGDAPPPTPETAAAVLCSLIVRSATRAIVKSVTF